MSSEQSLLLRSVKAVYRHLRHGRRIAEQKRALRSIAGSQGRKIVIGSSGTAPEGWVSTDREVIDLLQEESWFHYFEPASLDAILAEHVWEHLSPEDAVRSAKTCYRFLKPGGYLRAAVPDGLNPDPAYIEQVRPGGTGPGAADHRVLYDHASFCKVFALAGFSVRLYEYYDRSGSFRFSEWNPADGMIRRSMRFDERNSAQRLAYTSIVIDAVKPSEAGAADASASTLADEIGRRVRP
jgi:predicted SAM-dependent methyltransferase